MDEKKHAIDPDWHLTESANRAEHNKLIQTYHEQEKTRNKDRLLYPPDDIGPVHQLTYDNERRD